MEKWMYILLCCVATVPPTSSNGKFFVGFLGYKNNGNLGYDGECCDGERDSAGHCMETCDLIFQVSVYGLDRGNITNKRPSRRPINDTNSFMFSDEYKHAINPISFDFKKWPVRVLCLSDVAPAFNPGHYISTRLG
ncbi:uncharacterized protein LOC125372182 [Haliotis rufescens]|uniref:uncharacterized protein LOC125372182 n=1 Tax=Haliotis rufescens TaxID=6454 RepID=UPI00201EFEC3|nr:uncharacterized protein LOC125372182 [Haliotis rufescens]